MSERAPRDLTASCVTAGQSAVVIFSYPIEHRLLAGLTEAERDVVLGVLQGLSNKEIASARRRSVRTVANQLTCAFRKLGVQSRRELVALLSSDDPVMGGDS